MSSAPVHPELRPPSPWRRFVQRHLHDYPEPALQAWLLIALSGAAAGAWALWRLAAGPPVPHVALGLALGVAALASLLAVKLPRATYTFGVADLFILIALAELGPAVAVLCAGVDAGVAGWRNSRRLSSRVSSPAAAMAGMACGGATYLAAQAVLVGWGQSKEVAALAALCAAVVVHYLVGSMPLMALMALKRGVPLRPGTWLADTAVLAASYLGAALVAALLHLNALHFGVGVLAIAALLVLGLAALLRLSVARQEAERRAQEALVSEAQREAALSQKRFMAAFRHAAIGMAIVRPGDEILQVNLALCALLGRREADLLGQSFSGLLQAGDAAQFRRRAGRVLESAEEAFSMELRACGRGPDELWVALHCGRYEDPAIEGSCLICQLHDISPRRRAESRLHYIAYYDDLTDLANRHGFHERLDRVVEITRLDAGQRYAVMFLDLDRFKMVNDSLGHDAGNQLLRAVAQRLRGCVRASDLVARLGGDEFAILLEGLDDPATGLHLAQRVLDALGQQVSVNGTEIVPVASVGITFSDLGYRTAGELLRDADLAMYEAKAGGRGRVALFDGSMHERVAGKLALESELRQAIGQGQLTLQFQPLYELQPQRLCGFEALARWTHPRRGPVSPAVFIALAEESGHIEVLTDWAIEQAVAQLAQWQRSRPGAAGLGLHVNISGRDLMRPGLVEHVQQVLAAHALAPGQLTLEITETTLMGRLDQALSTMNRLRALGVRFSIDDFGTGYSSLAYLGTLPIDSLKIDRSFVMGMTERPHNQEIVRAVLRLGQSLGRTVIAEGIETAEQLAILRRLGVPVGQGYLLSRPLRAEQVLELLALDVPLLPA